jgi:hypothetical protein
MDTLQEQVDKLRKDLNDLNEEFYRNNYSTHQDFNKTVYFNARVKVPHYDTLPTTCTVGELAETGGKLRVCSASNTWTIVGTQS